MIIVWKRDFHAQIHLRLEMALVPPTRREQILAMKPRFQTGGQVPFLNVFHCMEE
jgi:hypothetical protein